MKLLDSVRNFCAAHAKTNVWIALSGGVDSRVLLDVCHQISSQTSYHFHVAHVHHGLSKNADHWAEKCKQWSESCGFPFYLQKIKVTVQPGTSLEEAARDARYQALAELIDQDDLLLTAQHQDDQAETVLLQLLRGAGPKGLSAMPPLKTFASGFHGRPLLNCSRMEIWLYAKELELEWIEDESNCNEKLTRNFLRQTIIPPLKSRWANIESVLARSAAHCAEAQQLLEESAQEKLPLVAGSKPGTLSVAKLLQFDAAWQRQLLRTWIETQGYKLPDTNKILSIQTSVLGAGWDRTPCVAWGDVEVKRHRDDVYIVKPYRLTELHGEWQWDLRDPLNLPCGRLLSADTVTGSGLKTDIDMVTVRYRVHGESVNIGARGKISLKNLYQEWCIPVWERGCLPLIFCGDKLVQVPGYFLDEEFGAGINIAVIPA